MKKCPGCMSEYGDEKTVCPFCGWSDEKMYGQQKSFPEALQPGMALGNRYLVGQVIRQDAFSILYVGWDELLRNKVCIEEFFPSDLVYRKYPETAGSSGSIRVPAGLRKEEDADLFEKGKAAFIRESSYLHTLQRIPELVQIYRVLCENDTLYRVMEYLEGDRLSKELEKDITRNSVFDREFLLILLNALLSLHKEGVGHMNLTPENIILVGGDIRYKMVKLISFGMARAQLHILMGGKSGLYREKKEAVYLAPELVKGEKTSPESADAYSYGAICRRFPGCSEGISELMAGKAEERKLLEELDRENREDGI